MTTNNRELLDAQAACQTGNELVLRMIDITAITVPPNHLRTDYGDIEELQGSIRREGMLEPLTVCETDQDEFIVIDGARRLKVAMDLGMEQISCLVQRDLSKADVAHLSYVKNVERKTLSAIEIARHINTMKDEFGYTLDELELKGYGSRTAISEKLKLLELPDKVQTMVHNGTLTSGHAKPLLRLPSVEEQERMAKRIVNFDLPVRVVEDRIRRYLAKKRTATKVRQKEIIPSDDVPGVYFKDSRDMSELPDKCVHLIVTSPPYFIGMEFEIGMTFKEHLANIRDVMKECARVLVPGGIIALNLCDILNYRGNNGTSEQPQVQFMGHRYQTYLRKYGVILTDIIIWAKRPAWSKDRYKSYKEDTVHTSYRIIDNWEPIYIFRKKGERDIPPEDIVLKSKLTHQQWVAYVSGVWDIEPVRNNKGHPCVYPDELVKRA